MGGFSYPSSVPSPNHDFELNLASLLVSCDISEAGPRLLRNISVLLNGKRYLLSRAQTLLRHLWINLRVPSLFSSPRHFPSLSTAQKKELFSNPLVHPLICRRTALPRQMLCLHSHGLLQIFSLFWITVKTEGC